MDQKELRPKVGVGVMVLKDGKVLLGRRIYGDLKGVYIFPGGKLDYMESIMQCARRETREEAGIEIKNIRFLVVRNEKDHPLMHYLNIGFIADWESGEARVMEPDKFDSWNWYELDKLPSPIFSSSAAYIEAYKIGEKFYDA